MIKAKGFFLKLSRINMNNILTEISGIKNLHVIYNKNVEKITHDISFLKLAYMYIYRSF